MKNVIVLLAAFAATALAQTPAPAPLNANEVVRVVEVKQGEANDIYYTLQRVFPGVSVNGRMLIVRGPESVVGTIEEAIKKLDVPPAPKPEARAAANVELTVYLLYGSSQEDNAAKVPAELDATVRKMRALFPYKSYRVLDTQIMRSRDGQQTAASGNLPGGRSSFSFRFLPRVSAGPAPRTVRVERLGLSVRLADKNTGQETGQASIETDIDAREGQTVVVGKANVTGTDDAIFLVVTPTVIQ
ncbi:MAG: hypothetical protein ABI811_13795 [Acidobacteriota bacterium]